MNNDRFRFRVWDEKVGEWIIPMSATQENELILGFDNCIVMQCTGLHDSEGTLIWEGDIVDSHFWRISGRKYKIQWFGHGFHAFELDESVGASFITDWANECKIIGNKYENPELFASPPAPTKEGRG